MKLFTLLLALLLPCTAYALEDEATDDGAPAEEEPAAEEPAAEDAPAADEDASAGEDAATADEEPSTDEAPAADEEAAADEATDEAADEAPAVAADATAQEPAAAPPATEEVVVPGPWSWSRFQVGLSYAQLGLLGRARSEFRGPMGRTPSIVFQNTFMGAGIDFAVSPAFVQVGPRFTLAPIDVFDVTFGFNYNYTWRSSAGLLPYDDITGTLEAQREAIKDTAVASSRFMIRINPTVKLKVGPVIAFWSAEWAFIHTPIPSGVSSPYVYEAMRDMVMAWDDLVVTNIAGVLVEILDFTGPKGGNGPRLRVGAITRDRQTFHSRDIGTALGGVVSFKPGPKPGWPDILLVVQGYLRDFDRQFAAPNIQIQFSWILEKPFKKKSKQSQAVAAQVADQLKTALR